MRFQAARRIGHCALRCGKASGKTQLKATTQRQKARATGGRSPRRPRLITMLPAQNSEVRTSRKYGLRCRRRMISIVTRNRPWPVGRFKLSDLVGDQLQLDAGDGIGQMMRLRGANDRRGNPRP